MPCLPGSTGSSLCQNPVCDENRCSKWICLYYWLGAGVVLSFELLTIGRTGWVAAVLMIGFFLWMICKLKSYKNGLGI